MSILKYLNYTLITDIREGKLWLDLKETPKIKRMVTIERQGNKLFVCVSKKIEFPTNAKNITLLQDKGRNEKNKRFSTVKIGYENTRCKTFNSEFTGLEEKDEIKMVKIGRNAKNVSLTKKPLFASH